MPVFGMVALDKVQQIPIGHGMLLQGEMDIGSKIVEPNFLGLHLRAGGLFVVKEHIGLDTGLIENTGGQAEDGMQIGGLEQLLADDLTGTALKQHIIRNHNGGSTGGFQNGVDMLDEIQLLVGAGCPEVLTVVNQFLVLLFALLVGDGDGGFFAEGRVGQNIVHPIAGVGQQGISQSHRHVAINITDVVQIQVHQCHFEGGSHQLIAVEGFVFQELLVLPAEGVVAGIGEKFLGRQEEAAAAAAGVYVPTEFDTIEKAFFGVKTVEKGIK